MSSTAPDDADVRDGTAQAVRRALVADFDAGFAALVDAYGGVAYSVARRVTAGPADAEDLAAEAFLRAYRSLRADRDRDPDRIAALAPRAWLLTIVVNTRRNQVRDAARRPRTDAGDADGGAERLPSPAAGPAERAENRELGTALATLLTHLPERQRVAVVLRHVVDLPIEEVADVLGCPRGTARSHVSRGLSRLRELLDQRPAPSGRNS